MRNCKRLVVVAAAVWLLAAAASAGTPKPLVSVDVLSQPAPALAAGVQVVEDLKTPAERLGPRLRARMQEGGVVPVMVLLKEPLVASTLTPYTASWDEARTLRLAVIEHEFANRAAGVGFRATKGLSHFPIVIGEIATEQLEALAADPLVAGIQLDGTVHASRIQGGALMKSDQLRNQGGRGSGIGVAIVDTGIDYNHTELKERNNVTKVPAGGDFTGSGQPYGLDDEGHGTACAGIVAGWDGGMAPQAHLWAIKVLDSEGSGQESWIADGLNAVYANRNDYGGVRVVSMSIQSSARWPGDCDYDSPAYAAAMQQLNGAGITIVVASGNHGCSDGVSTPSCVSYAISVGAVYDANIGGAQYGEGTCMPAGCTDATTAADKITCYSNSSNRLDALAPSHCAQTTALGGGFDPCFGGTSAACPYVAGVTAQILSLRPQTTPAQIKAAYLDTGKAITDARNGVTRKRVDAVAAYQYVQGSTCTAPGTPTNFRSSTLTVPSGTSFTLSWNAVSGADGYELQEATNSGFSGAVTLTSTATSMMRSHVVTGNTVYYYRARATRTCGAQSAWSATVSVTVTYSGASAYVYWIPVVANLSGSGNSQYRSDVGLLNRSSSTANVQMIYHGSTSASRSEALAVGRQRIFVHILGPSYLNVTGKGALEVRSDRALTVTSRTYNVTSLGTFGQYYGGYEPSDGLGQGQWGVLAQLTQNATYRTNIGVLNMGSTAAVVNVKLFNGFGSLVGEYNVTLNPGEYKQEDRVFGTKGGQTNMAEGYAKVTCTTGAGVIAVASVLDNGTSDPTTIELVP
ncbi:MAG: S8 family serine peptidase [Thermoanaerobaculaceae bacterium]|nr:S8 family serine peptidase [Thermoanaerobaculaceae bacterium]MDI9621792.1 S8 family serine peptidase [Acidobacteriota bacterium]NLH11690.1 S8 family serine peptidase [Holophagae bacterium]HPW56518.1 S8 family serine peptidase [Thermoanaerobaculaceae bacterium]